MNEEVNNNENNKKQKIAALVGLITLLLAVLGATYAFFQLDTDTESSNTTITGSTPDKSLVTLNQEISNLHLNISANDMSLNNVNNEYYATDVDGKAYEENEENGTKTIANLTLEDGDATTKYSCTAKLTVSKVTEPLDEADTMIDVLQPGDMILQFKGNIISEKLDLSELKASGSKEYNLSFKVTGNTPEEIQAYIKLINKETPQNYLAGSKLNIDIDTSELQCSVYIEHPTLAQLRAKDKEISGIEHISTDEQGGMYRYQGTDDVPNWICFGTTDKEQCTNEDTGIDKYMYRIIGITEEGQMYLLKETVLKEGTTNKFAWNSKYLISDCLGDTCEWPNSDIYKRLNGETSNGNPIFVDNSYYEYMTKNGDWYNLIADHDWMYGDTEPTVYIDEYNGDAMYGIETGKTPATRIWPDEEQGQTTCSSDDQCTRKPYTWSNSAKNVKIGLMYMHDIDYAYANCSSGECISRGNPGRYTNVKNSWIHFQKDGYNTSPSFERLLSRAGYNSAPGERNVIAWVMYSSGLAGGYNVYVPGGTRPVFYLSSDAKIADGGGTMDDPYILDVQIKQ